MTDAAGTATLKSAYTTTPGDAPRSSWGYTIVSPRWKDADDMALYD